jgi:hypothetical protein
MDISNASGASVIIDNCLLDRMWEDYQNTLVTICVHMLLNLLARVSHS